LETALARLKINEPLAYITSQRAFYGMDFKVTPAVLIPRPETELLIEEAIQWLENNPHRRSAVDVGTGSGIIAITLADTFLDLILTAIDISEEAIQVAQENAHVHQMDDRIRWQKNDLLTQIEGKFDIILANLPYIPTQILNSLDVGKFEPRLALDGGPDGLQLLRRLLRQAPDHLRVGGAIFLEIESTLGEPAIQLASECFPQANIDLLKDYAELPRLIKIQT
jgi:release factor glutamine methyltransferase